MGNQDVQQFSNTEAKKRFTRMLLTDIKALEQMLNDGMIEAGITRIGAEQELCLVDDHFNPKTNNMAILDGIADSHFVPEIAQFNIEANLDPQDFGGDCFERMEKQLRDLMEKAHAVALKENTKIVMTGILPTLRKKHLNFEHMSPNPRYKALDQEIKSRRGSDFELNILGVDELITNHDNILFEACNTSFQVHMQISPEQFTEKYNWALMISGPVLAMAANSPLLLGKRLWKETRIALFQQSVDTRSSTNIKREQEPRVTFGKDWLRGNVVDLYRDNVSRFNALFSTSDHQDAIHELEQGNIPELEALKMHNSTVYKWNRACYGVGGGKPHLRIENRYIPSGPTIKDEMANAAFWLGLMYAMPEDAKDLPTNVKFEDCRFNFYNACRSGMDSKFRWYNETLSTEELVQTKLLPMAKEGLSSAGVQQSSIDELLGIIEARINKNTNGAKWMLNNFSKLLKGSTANEASQNITEAIYNKQMKSQPVHEWDDIQADEVRQVKKYKTVSDIMETELYIAKEDDIIDLAANMMSWKNIRSIPVENAKHELVGLITAKELLNYLTMPEARRPETVAEIMTTDYVSIAPDASTNELVDVLAETRAECVLVTEGKLLSGLVSQGDIVQVARITEIFKK